MNGEGDSNFMDLPLGNFSHQGFMENKKLSDLYLCQVSHHLEWKQMKRMLHDDYDGLLGKQLYRVCVHRYSGIRHWTLTWLMEVGIKILGTAPGLRGVLPGAHCSIVGLLGLSTSGCSP